MSSDVNRVMDILESIKKIDYLLAGIDKDTFLAKNSLEKQLAVSMCFAILGEAAGKLSPELRKTNPKIPWHNMIGMRNVLIHDYVKINYEDIWDTAKNDLPKLKRQIEKILKIEQQKIQENPPHHKMKI